MTDASGNKITPNAPVAWNWGQGHAEGHVSEISDSKLSKEIKGKQITRNGTPSNPALYITNDKKSSNAVVKKASEVHVLEDGEEVPGNEKVETSRHHKE